MSMARDDKYGGGAYYSGCQFNMSQNMQNGYYIEELSPGMESSFDKQVTAEDIDTFAQLTGDTNPIHIDAEYAAQTPFKQRIAHGMLNGGLISTVLGAQLPGPGCIYLEQQLRFKAPVMIGDTVTAKVTVEEVNVRRRRVTLKTECLVNGKVITTGSATMMVDNQPA